MSETINERTHTKGLAISGVSTLQRNSSKPERRRWNRTDPTVHNNASPGTKNQMTAVNVTKIRAVIEDPREPNLSCYASDIATLAAVAVSKVFANHQTTHTPKKADTNMISINSSNPNYMSDDDVLKASKKRYIPGIMGIDNPVALVKTLNRLGLCSNEMADPLQKLAAQKRPLAEFFTVSVHEVDRALKDVECSPQDRIGFKNSLLRAKLMTA